MGGNWFSFVDWGIDMRECHPGRTEMLPLKKRAPQRRSHEVEVYYEIRGSGVQEDNRSKTRKKEST